jgi:MYXO-CTERM domain-containing protein
VASASSSLASTAACALGLASWLVAPVAVAARPASVGWVDGTAGRARCHHDRAADADLCKKVAAWAEQALAVQVDALGFRAPLPDAGLGGTDALDVYLSETAGGAGSAFVTCDGAVCTDADPTDGVAAAPAYVVIDPRTDVAELPHYVHHEIDHVLQYATDFAERSLCFWEGTAAAAERWTDPSWSTIPEDLVDYQRAPWASAVLHDGYYLEEAHGIVAGGSGYEYGCAAWIFWMDATHGDGAGGIGPKLWELSAQEGPGDEPDVVDAWATVAGGFEASMLAFAAERARIGTTAGPAWAAFAGEAAYAWREPPIATLPATVVPTEPPYPLGTSYFDVEARSGERLQLALEADPAVRWGLAAVEASAASIIVATTLEHAVLADGPVTAAVVNLGPVGFDGDDPLAQASFTLHLERVAAEPEAATPGAQGHAVSGGCGCRLGARAPETPGWLFAFALGAVLLRRRRDQGAAPAHAPAHAVFSQAASLPLRAAPVGWLAAQVSEHG